MIRDLTESSPRKSASSVSEELTVGDYIFSKNGMEFDARVTAIRGNKVSVVYDIEGYGDETHSTVPRSKIKGSKGDWYAANWTF